MPKCLAMPLIQTSEYLKYMKKETKYGKISRELFLARRNLGKETFVQNEYRKFYCI